MNHNQKYNGTSLLEILLYVALTSTILISITMAYSQTLQIRQENGAKRALHSQGEFLISKVESEIRSADSVILPTPNQSADSLELSIPGETQNTLITLTGSGVQISEDGSVNNLTTDIEIVGINFTTRSTGDEPPIIDYSFTLKRNVADKAYEAIYSGSTTIRR